MLPAARPKAPLRDALFRPLHLDGLRARLLPAGPAVATALVLSNGRANFELLVLAALSWLIFYGLLRISLYQKQHSERISDLRDQLFSLWGLVGLVGPDHQLLPALGNYALDATRAHRLLWEIVQKQPRSVVELGPGASTVLLDLVRGPHIPRFELYSVEHDERFIESMRSLVAYHGIRDVHLIAAPLEPQQFGKWSGNWYRRDALAQIPEGVDFLVVDGPPGTLTTQSRYPALLALRSRLAKGAVIFVDDADRADERAMIEQWLQDDNSVRLQHDGRSYVILTA